MVVLDNILFYHVFFDFQVLFLPCLVCWLASSIQLWLSQPDAWPYEVRRHSLGVHCLFLSGWIEDKVYKMPLFHSTQMQYDYKKTGWLELSRLLLGRKKFQWLTKSTIWTSGQKEINATYDHCHFVVPIQAIVTKLLIGHQLLTASTSFPVQHWDSLQHLNQDAQQCTHWVIHNECQWSGGPGCGMWTNK